MSDNEGKNGRRASRSVSRSSSKSSRRSRSHSAPRGTSRSGSRPGSEAGRKSASHSSKSRSRSRSPRRSPPRRGGGGGYSGSGGSRRPGRSRSRSPLSRRRRHMGNRDDPEPNRCLGVFGLSLYTQERDIKEVFGKYGPIENVQVVYDHQTGRSRGFAFVYYEEVDDAAEAKERCNGIEIDGRRIRVDFSVTERAHTPTPGVYLGKPTRRRRSTSPPRGYYRRSLSPYRRGRYSRSRSRSYSPRRY